MPSAPRRTGPPPSSSSFYNSTAPAPSEDTDFDVPPAYLPLGGELREHELRRDERRRRRVDHAREPARRRVERDREPVQEVREEEQHDDVDALERVLEERVRVVREQEVGAAGRERIRDRFSMERWRYISSSPSLSVL